MKVSSILGMMLLLLVHPAQGMGDIRLEKSACPECSWSLPQLASSFGYMMESHFVKTEDDFVLTMFRMYRETDSVPMIDRRPAVLLQHGIFDSAAGWMMNLPTQSLAYILVDAGYDVWMGNNRGNIFSVPSCTSAKCWSFSFHEMGMFDLPAMINYVVDRKQNATITYVGHSQGCTQMLLRLSRTSDLSKKLNLFIALAPVAHVGKQTSLFLRVLSDIDLAFLMKKVGVHDLLPRSVLLRELTKILCNGGVTTFVCEDIIFSIAGKDDALYHNLNKTRIDLYTNWNPAGTSIFDFAHWTQLVKSGEFEPYDYGTEENTIRYGTDPPTAYRLEAISKTLPIAIFSGGQDTLADPADVLLLKKRLPAGSVVYEEEIQMYDHLDFIWGLDAHQRIYGRVVELIHKYSDNSVQQIA